MRKVNQRGLRRLSNLTQRLHPPENAVDTSFGVYLLKKEKSACWNLLRNWQGLPGEVL
jgi:hypothetical protein